MSKQFATAADFTKTFRTKDFDLLDGRRVQFKAITELDILNTQKDVLDAALMDRGVKNLDDIKTRENYCASLNPAQMTEFMLEVARRVICYAMVKPRFTLLDIGPDSDKAHVDSLMPSDIMDIYLEIEAFSGIEREALAQFREKREMLKQESTPDDVNDIPDTDDGAPDSAQETTESADASPDTVQTDSDADVDN